MNNETTLKIFSTISIIGILFLLILANSIKPQELKIKDINNNYLDKKIQTKGEIINIKTYQKSNFQVLTIADNNNKIDITLDYLINLTINQSIIVIGTFKQYKNDLQIQADEIILD